jgi:heme-degrading monooxygenase HmoA
LITHIVLFKLLESRVSEAAQVREVLAGMAGKIPQLRHLEVGINLIHSDRSYDLALVARFDSLEDLQAYQNHPVHVEVVKYMQEVRQSAVAVDYESP